MADRNATHDSERTYAGQETSDQLSNAKQKISETVSEARDRARQAGEAIAHQVDEKREPVAGMLDTAASTLQDRGARSGQAVSDAAKRTADVLSSTADYVRGHDVKAMVDDVEQVVRHNPGRSLLIAAAMGFLVGRAFRNE
ncbi:MAG: Late embryosis abundant protein [Bryobacterales bacterium]|nr:Late embryosis abundant protein [Bryobacterales bacterium]